MGEFLSKLFATDFTRRFDCVNSDDVMWMLIASDLLIFVAYMLVPISLIVFYRRTRSAAAPRWRIVYLIGTIVFTAFCGGGHLWLCLLAWFPTYRAFALWNVATALISIAFALVLPWVVKAATSPAGRLEIAHEAIELLVKQREELLRERELVRARFEAAKRRAGE